MLRRRVIERERLGLYELDTSVNAGETVAVQEPASWLPFVPVQTIRSVAPVAAVESARPLSTVRPSATIDVELAVDGPSTMIYWSATEHRVLLAQ